MDVNALMALFILLVAAGGLGWAAARWRGRPSNRRLSRFINGEYFKGLNYLLNEQPDKAIEVFIRMVEADSDTIETHFALGNLFRRRGEVDRAIRIHQNLIARTNLARNDRAQALYQLGEDYMRAGLFDRAESLFSELTDIQDHVEPALRHLATIYEQQKDWDQAIDSRRRLEQVTGDSEQAVIAQYYCELAQTALENHDEAGAKRHLQHAQSHDKECVRAKLLAGDLACSAGDWKTGYRYYRDVLEIEMTFATEVLPPLVRTLNHSTNQAALDDLLRHLCARHKGAANQIALAAILEPGLNSAIARECVNQYMRTAPGLRGVYDMFVSLTGHGTVAETDNVAPVQIALRRLLENGPRYKCEQCGFTAKTLYWQCPSCKTWNSTKPFHDIGFGPVAIPASATT